MNSIKKWFLNKLTSPLLNRTECHDFQVELKHDQKNNHREFYESAVQHSKRPTNKEKPRAPRASSLSGPVNRIQTNSSYKSPSIKKSKESDHPPAVKSRHKSQEGVRGGHQKPHAPLAPHAVNESCSFINLQDIITDNIGNRFFKSVLGRSDTVQSMSKLVRQESAAGSRRATPKSLRNRSVTPNNRQESLVSDCQRYSRPVIPKKKFTPVKPVNSGNIVCLIIFFSIFFMTDVVR